MIQDTTTFTSKGIQMDVATLAELLHETAQHHDSFEKAAPPHDWWDWYAPYLQARRNGSSPDEAEQAADTYMAETKQIVAPSRVRPASMA